MIHTTLRLGALSLILWSVSAWAADPPAERLSAWLDELQSNEEAVVVEAATALGQEGAEAAAAVPELQRRLSDESPDVRAAATRALGRIGVGNPSLTSQLMDLLDDQARTSEARLVWVEAAGALQNLPVDVAPLIERLRSETIHQQLGAAIALHGHGAEAPDAIPLLVGMTQEANPSSRHVALYSLMGFGPLAGDAVPQLLPLLDSEDFHTQYWCCRVLGKIGAPHALPAVPILLRLLQEGVASVRRNAVAALGAIGPEAGSDILEPMAAALEDPLFTVRESAAIALGELGEFARPVAPSLEAALADRRRGAQAQLAVAVFQTSGDRETALKVLLKEIQGKSHPWEAATGFAAFGAQGAPAVAELTDLLGSENAELRYHAAVALGGIGPAAKEALPLLKTLLQQAHEDPEEDDLLRDTLAATIAKIESGTPEESKGDEE